VLKEPLDELVIAWGGLRPVVPEEGVISAAPPDSSLRDRIFVSFMVGYKYDPLLFILPDKVSEALYPKRQLLLGHPVVGAAVLTVVLFSAAFSTLMGYITFGPDEDISIYVVGTGLIILWASLMILGLLRVASYAGKAEAPIEQVPCRA
jgi:hypothetical protein